LAAPVVGRQVHEFWSREQPESAQNEGSRSKICRLQGVLIKYQAIA
jgi:hypothetical protein